jgi:predicted  nucleic acid-binding Zn-ribbon protein
MHPELELLLQIQDLKSQRRELIEHEPNRELQQQEFNIDVDQAVQQLETRIDELKQDLQPANRARLEKFSAGQGRAVAPVINGICYGCFTAVPTASMSGLSRNDRVNFCETCGRFLYVVNG